MPAKYVNAKEGAGCSTLLRKGDKLKGKITVYFNSEKAKTEWDGKVGRIVMTLYITNTTITGVQFKENVQLELAAFTDNYYPKYGTNTLEQDYGLAEKNAYI